MYSIFRVQLRLRCLLVPASLIIFPVLSSHAGEPYDYFQNIQFPGERRADVSLDRVEQANGDGYLRRTVQWWPKAGVDIVDVPEDVPLRTWTINPETSRAPSSPSESDAKWWPLALRGKKQFQAHLLGFRGIGLGIGNPWRRNPDDPEYFCPAVVLRLEDGRKRCFTRGSFIEKDERYLTELYESEMARIRSLDISGERTVSAKVRSEYGNDPLYTAGSTTIETNHFVAVLGTEPPGDRAGSLWLDGDDKDKAARNRELIMRGWEDWWAYNAYAGHLMPWQERLEKYKYKITIGGTKKNGVEILARGNGGSYGGMTTPNGNWWGLFHEWTHGALAGDMRSLGGAETICDAAQIVGDPSTVQKVMLQMQRPWKNLFWGQYPGGLGWTMMGDDPNWGYAAPATIAPLMSAEESTPMHAIARLGERRGIFKNGIRGMGDFLGQIGARMAELDTELESGFRERFVSADRTALMPVDIATGRYRSPAFESPEPFGVNLVRLLPESGAKSVTVDFAGEFDPETFSDWRCCLVAVDAEGRCRYSPLWNKGEMSIDILPADRRFWLTVVATPYALAAHQDGAGTEIWTVYQGGFAWRYPYEVQITGARPGSPHLSVADNDNLTLIGHDRFRATSRGEWPALPDDPGYAATKEALEQITRGEGAPAKRAQNLLANAEGARHKNGGGWVAKTAKVEPTAFIGRDAMVLDRAQVLGRAVISNSAIVKDNAIVRDRARVFNKTVISGNAVIDGEARIYQSFDRKAEDPQVSSPQKRPRFVEREETLLAAYEMNVAEAVLLEDHFQARSTDSFYFGVHRDPIIMFSGVLRGKPGFEQDGERRALTFDGQNQFAELAGEVADLESITIATAMKWTGGEKRQTLFEFCSTPTDFFRLSIESNGQLLLSLGAESFLSDAAIKAGAWTDCRVEIDGNAATVWIDGVSILRQSTDFRASDAFIPGKEHRGFLAASRAGNLPFQGSLDYLRIYHAVYPDFSKVPPAPLISSRKVQDNFKLRFDKRFAGYDQLENEIEAMVENDRIHRFYTNWNKRVDQTMAELESSPELDALLARIEELKTQEQAVTSSIRQELSKDPEFRERDRRLKEVQKQHLQTLTKLMNQDPEYAANQELLDYATGKLRNIDQTIKGIAEKSNLRYRTLKSKAEAINQKINLLSAEIEKLDPGAQQAKAELEALQSVKGPLRDEEKIRLAARAYGDVRAKLRHSPKFKKLQKEQQTLNKEMLAVRQEMAQRDPAYKAAKMDETQARKAYIKRRNAVKRHPDLVSLENERRALSPNLLIDLAKGKQESDISREIVKLEGQVEKVRIEKALQTHPELYKALDGLAFGRRQYEREVLEGLKKNKLPAVSEDIEQAIIARRHQQGQWHTKVEWEGRAPFELDKKSMAQPVMQAWTKRMKPWRYQ